MSAAVNLLARVRVGPFDLPNRIVMSPLTRLRATPAQAFVIFIPVHP